MSKRRKNKFLVSAISLFLVISAAEVVMRFAWRMGGWVERPIYRRSSNPYLRYELVPQAESGLITVNSDGFRGREYSIPKPPNTFRILMLGDSETLSIMLPQSDTLAAQLENLLNKLSGNLRYEVLNFGVEGYNTFQELEQLKTKGLKYDPDLIILNYVLNDPEPGEYYLNKTFLMRKSALVRYFTYRFKKAAIRRERKKLNIRTEIEHFYYLHQPKYFDRLKEGIQEMAGISRQLGNKLIVVIFPTSSLMVKDFKGNYPYLSLHSLVKGVESDNIVFVDLLDEFRRLVLSPQEVSINYAYNESHKNAMALGVSASYICRLLRSKNIIPNFARLLPKQAKSARKGAFGKSDDDLPILP